MAFFNGVVSHYIADENWHGLCAGCDNKGLIKQIGYSEFDCTGDLCWDAHHATDMGGDLELDKNYHTGCQFILTLNIDVNNLQSRTLAKLV